MHKEERWLTIKNAPNYDVSDQGRVRNGRRFKVLKPFRQNRGYLQIRITDKHGNPWKPTVHRLVASAFLGDLELEVNHRDLDKTNNHATNLEYVTRPQNMKHAAAHGIWPQHNHFAAKLDAAKVLEIRAASAAGDGYAKIAKAYGMEKSTIAAIVKRRTWRHI